MLSLGSGSTGRFFHSFEIGVSVAVVDLDVGVVGVNVWGKSVRLSDAGVMVTGGTVPAVRVCTVDGVLLYRGVGI